MMPFHSSVTLPLLFIHVDVIPLLMYTPSIVLYLMRSSPCSCKSLLLFSTWWGHPPAHVYPFYCSLPDEVIHLLMYTPSTVLYLMRSSICSCIPLLLFFTWWGHPSAHVYPFYCSLPDDVIHLLMYTPSIVLYLMRSSTCSCTPLLLFSTWWGHPPAHVHPFYCSLPDEVIHLLMYTPSTVLYPMRSSTCSCTPLLLLYTWWGHTLAHAYPFYCSLPGVIPLFMYTPSVVLYLMMLSPAPVSPFRYMLKSPLPPPPPQHLAPVCNPPILVCRLMSFPNIHAVSTLLTPDQPVTVQYNTLVASSRWCHPSRMCCKLILGVKRSVKLDTLHFVCSTGMSTPLHSKQRWLTQPHAVVTDLQGRRGSNLRPQPSPPALRLFSPHGRRRC